MNNNRYWYLYFDFSEIWLDCIHIIRDGKKCNKVTYLTRQASSINTSFLTLTLRVQSNFP